jgi:hypothetical protein
MSTDSRTFAFGTLEENGDTWLLITRDRMILLDLALSRSDVGAQNSQRHRQDGHSAQLFRNQAHR